MNFQVPQFIEVENKVFGPLSFPQFIFIAGGLAVAFLWYVILPSLYLALIPMIASVGVGLAFAFYRINNRSLIYAIQSIIRYGLSGKLYLWQKDQRPATNPGPAGSQANEGERVSSRISANKLAELSWSLDVKEKIH